MRQINFNQPPRIFLTPRHGCLRAFVLGLGLSLLACGGSKQTTRPEMTEGEVDIDKLLSTPADEEKQNSEDAEVLRLLGITPENASTSAPKMEPQVTEPKTDPAPSGVTDLQKEVDRLQSELNIKNQQIADLRSSLMERDAKLQEAGRMQQPVSGLTGGNGFMQRYAEARDLYEQRRYAEAAAAFQAILAENDKSSYADNCQYWIGESYYGLGKFPQAIAEFEKVFTFPRSNKSDAALLKIGLCYLRMGEPQQARSQLEQLIATYPNSPYVANARRYLARL